MIPSNLKIGDTYTEESVDGKVFASKIIGFDGQGRYISEFVGMVCPEEPKAVVVEEPVAEEKTPIEEMLSEPKPEKKPATRKAPAKRKRTPAKKA